MKKATVISLLLIVIGFLFEYAYFIVENQFLDIKFWLSGVFCIIIGSIGLWLYTILPWMEEKKSQH